MKNFPIHVNQTTKTPTQAQFDSNHVPNAGSGKGATFRTSAFVVLPFDELAICFPESMTWIWFEEVYMTDCFFTFIVFFSFLFCMFESYVKKRMDAAALDSGMGEPDRSNIHEPVEQGILRIHQ